MLWQQYEDIPETLANWFQTPCPTGKPGWYYFTDQAISHCHTWDKYCGCHFCCEQRRKSYTHSFHILSEVILGNVYQPWDSFRMPKVLPTTRRNWLGQKIAVQYDSAIRRGGRYPYAATDIAVQNDGCRRINLFCVYNSYKLQPRYLVKLKHTHKQPHDYNDYDL